MRKILLFIFSFFLLLGSVSASQILVENVFSDIESDYEYRDELQALYDRGMILPDGTWKFSPDEYLNRDEFVGIAMEVICERCIQPHTEYKFIEKYLNEDVYFDINNTNPYFYCVAEADALNYVRWYDIGQQCQDGTSAFGERPFCPLNRINLEEAVAVLLRNSWIFTIEDNQNVISSIYAWTISQTLWNDVLPTDLDGNPYTFYGYIEKALEYQIEEYTSDGNSKVYKLLETDAEGNVNPQKSITKEEFLRMSYIALKSNSCNEIVDNNLALAIDIWEKACELWDSDCTISDLNDPEDTYDFTPDVQWFCEDGIDDPTWYAWRFYNVNNGQEFFHYGKFLDNITLPTTWEWKIYLTVRDKCWNSGEVHSTIIVDDDSDPIDPTGDELALNVDILAEPIYGPEDLLVDFEGVVYGWTAPYEYIWDFWDSEDGVWKNIEHIFTSIWVYEILLRVIDTNGLTGTATVLIKVIDGDACQSDSDGDGIVDCEDLCPTVAWNVINSGCPIYETSCDISCWCEEGYICSDNDPLTCSAWICVPEFDPKSSCLYTPGVWSIYGSAVCSSCPCGNYLDFLADVRRCDLVFPAITSPDGKQIYSKGDIWQVQ